MGKITGGEQLVRALKAEGVETIFGLPGQAVFPAYDACLTERVAVVSCRHEAAAVHMAEGYARARGRPAVAMVTEGPGHSNAIPGMAAAYAENSPILLISGTAESYNLGKGAMQELPQVEMCAPIAKWSAMVPCAQRLPEYVARAFRFLCSGMPGPVHLTIPADLLDELVDDEAVAIIPSRSLGPTTRPAADATAIDQVVELLAKAERPAIVAGTAAFWAKAGATLQTFVERTGIPVFTVDGGRGLVSDDHPLCFGQGYSSVNRAAVNLRHADVVLLLGEKMDFRFSFGFSFGKEARLVHVYPDPDEVGKNRPVAVGIVADPGTVMEQMVASAERRVWPRHNAWVESLRIARQQQQEEFRKLAEANEPPVHPLRLAQELETFITDETFLAFEYGNFGAWLRSSLKALRPGSWLLNNGLGMLGTGLPYALGAKVAFPKTRVILLTGDGSFGFYAMEFDTAVRHGIPVVAIVGNDAAWGIEQHFQRAMFGDDRLVGTSLLPTRYDEVVKALGGHGEYVERPEQLRPALERAFASGRPACINVAVQSEASPRVAALTRLMERRRAQVRGEQTG